MRILRVMSGVLALALISSCVEGPFEHVNPNDPAVEFTMSIVASRDTVTTDARVVNFRLVTDPQITGYEPAWSATPAGLAVHLGGGTFVVVAGPPTSILITASYLGRSVSYNLTRVP